VKLLQLSQGNSFYIDKALDSQSFEKSLRVAAVKAYDCPQIDLNLLFRQCSL
jgi:hypothetical protein